MRRRRDENYLYVTWLSRLMSGENQCAWGPWFKAHFEGYEKAPSDFQVATWQMEHNDLLQSLAAERRALGETCFRERQNRFTVRVSPTMLMSGVPDLVTVSPHGEVTVFDAKTGSPHQSDLVQVMLYMLGLGSTPLHKGKRLAGCVVYRSSERATIPAEAITPEFKQRARSYANLLDADTPPPRTPSAGDCRFCGIAGSECADRIEWVPAGGSDAPSIDWG